MFDEEESSVGSLSLSQGEHVDDSSFRVDCSFVMWRNSSIEDCDEFYELLVGKMPSGTRVYGVQGRDKSEGLMYVVVMEFACGVYWIELEKKERFVLTKGDGSVDTDDVYYCGFVLSACKECKVSCLKSVGRWCWPLRNHVLFGTSFTTGLLSRCELDDMLAATRWTARKKLDVDGADLSVEGARYGLDAVVCLEEFSAPNALYGILDGEKILSEGIGSLAVR